MTDQPYTPPRVWQWEQPSGGRFASINRPVAGPTHEAELPVGKHPHQLYSLGTPNGQKVTILFEELLEAGHADAEYDAWPIDIMKGEQFSTGFVAINPNSKIPALLDRSTNPPTRVFESGAILVYLAEKFGQFLPPRVLRGPSASPGSSGKWVPPPTWAEASGTSTPTRPSSCNTPSTASPWKSSASSTCSTATSPNAAS